MNSSSSVRRVAAVSSAALVASIVTAVPVSGATVAPLNHDCVADGLGQRVTVTATFTIVMLDKVFSGSPVRYLEGSAAISSTALGAPVALAAPTPPPAPIKVDSATKAKAKYVK